MPCRCCSVSVSRQLVSLLLLLLLLLLPPLPLEHMLNNYLLFKENLLTRSAALCMYGAVLLSLTHHMSVLGWQPDSHLSYTPPSSSASNPSLLDCMLYLTGHEGADCCARAVLLHRASKAPASTRMPTCPMRLAIPCLIAYTYFMEVLLAGLWLKKACAPRAVQYCSADPTWVCMCIYDIFLRYFYLDKYIIGNVPLATMNSGTVGPHPFRTTEGACDSTALVNSPFRAYATISARRCMCSCSLPDSSLQVCWTVHHLSVAVVAYICSQSLRADTRTRSPCISLYLY
jgi:hypothetical protein